MDKALSRWLLSDPPFNRTLNKVLTHYRLEFTVHRAKQEKTLLHFQNNHKEAVAVPLSSRSYKRLTLKIRSEQTVSPFPDTIDLQEALLEAA